MFDIASFMLGLFIGIIGILLIMVLIIYIANKRFIKMSAQSLDIKNKDVKNIIASKRKEILTSTKLGINSNFELIKKVNKELVSDIANYYYPNSKYPELEIRLDEVLEMNERICVRINQILDTKGLSILKKIRISQIVYILETKDKIQDHSLYKFSKKFKIDNIISSGYTLLNIANPTYWIRKLIFTSTLETSLRGVAIVSINIIGEEVNRLYGKKLIDNNEKILEKEIKAFIKEIENSY